MQAVIRTLLLSKALRCHCSLGFHENVASGEELSTVKPGKTKLPSSNEGKAACPLGYLCSGRAVALVRFIFLFAKNRDLKYQMHLQGIRELTGGKTPNCCIIMFIRKTRFLMEK